MAIVGASWGLNLTRVTPVAKLVAIWIGDAGDTDGYGMLGLNELAEFCCSTEADVLSAFRALAASDDVAWGKYGQTINYRLPAAARTRPRDKAEPQDGVLTLYVVTGHPGTKIGITKSINDRVETLKAAIVGDVVLCWHQNGRASVIRRAERLAHEILSDHRVQGEWFSVSIDDAIAAAKVALTDAEKPPQ